MDQSLAGRQRQQDLAFACDLFRIERQHPDMVVVAHRRDGNAGLAGAFADLIQRRQRDHRAQAAFAIHIQEGGRAPDGIAARLRVRHAVVDALDDARQTQQPVRGAAPQFGFKQQVGLRGGVARRGAGLFQRTDADLPCLPHFYRCRHSLG
ncbi:hypothetical protein D9M69_631890 [compost metagenome]